MEKRYLRVSYLKLLTAHLAIPRPPIQVILGPRQVGKTTTIFHYLENMVGNFQSLFNLTLFTAVDGLPSSVFAYHE